MLIDLCLDNGGRVAAGEFYDNLLLDFKFIAVHVFLEAVIAMNIHAP